MEPVEVGMCVNETGLCLLVVMWGKVWCLELVGMNDKNKWLVV